RVCSVVLRCCVCGVGGGGGGGGGGGTGINDLAGGDQAHGLGEGGAHLFVDSNQTLPHIHLDKSTHTHTHTHTHTRTHTHTHPSSICFIASLWHWRLHSLLSQ